MRRFFELSKVEMSIYGLSLAVPILCGILISIASI